ncbi:MAG: GeoRSP system SPASM domain protein [Nitrospiraceae bacterium]|nr:MAG: GeoRSP system SPASM domain protein [Nitrospiraceae bacterium]
MNLKELAFPIRIYWDLSPAPDNATIDYPGICREIVEMRFFSLNLRDAGVELSSTCMEILEALNNKPIAVALTVSRSVINPSMMTRLSGLKVKELLIDAFTDEDFRFIAELRNQYNNSTMVIGASFQINKYNYRGIPDIISFCLNNDLTRIVFPMQRLTAKEECFYISRQDGKDLSNKLYPLNTGNLKLTIHDPFLWRVFYPDTAFPGAGCQAGNSMAYISPEGNVYPCPSMPKILGNLNNSPLKILLSSALKKELVKSLRKSPVACLGCKEIDHCIGGCRGRTIALSDSLELRDPACQ